MEILSRLRTKKQFLLVFVIATLTYITFFYKLLNPNYFFWGSDAEIKNYPARVYFYNVITKEHRFPFWTEKIFSGFPIYADIENAYLNPVNVVSILIFGPMLSYKILHFFTYILGSVALFYFLKRKGIGMHGYFIANLVYYFSFFSLNHQIHFNFIMGIYLLPLSLLLVDLFFEHKTLKQIILQSLVIANAVLWGSMQIVLLIFISIFLYTLFMYFSKNSWRQFTFYLLSVLFLTVITTLPQTLVTYNLFNESKRGAGISSDQGSLAPNMAAVVGYPFLFGRWDNYLGRELAYDYTYTEIYIYMGIATLILAVYGITIIREQKILRFLYSMIWLFLILGFFKYIPLSDLDRLPILGLFRYWERSVFLATFGVAILAGYAVENIGRVRPQKKQVILIILPALYLLVLSALNIKNGTERNIFQYVFANITKLSSTGDFRMWVFISVLTLAAIIFLKNHKKLKLILCGLVLLDLVYFGADLVKTRLDVVGDLQKIQLAPELANRRILNISSNIIGNETLYYSAWFPTGYSQFVDTEYLAKYQSVGIPDIKNPNVLNPNINTYIKILRPLGIIALQQNNNAIYIDSRIKDIDLFKSKISGSYTKKSEGNLSMDINIPADGNIDTYIRYNPNWVIKIDGINAKSKENGLFIQFYAKAGQHKVDIYYFPRDFRTGVIISAVTLALLASVATFFGILKKYA